MIRLKRDRKGSIAPFTAITAVVLIGFGGLAVDTTRAWLVEARMKSALDSAALLAARRFDVGATQTESDNIRTTEARQIFWANIEQGGRPRTYLGATIADPAVVVVDRAAQLVRVSSTARVPTTLFRVLSTDDVVRSDFAVAQRIGTGLELALVLDTTGSMAANGFGGRTKFQNAVDAMNQLLDTLYAGDDAQRNLFVSLVPADRAINIGNTAEGRAMLETSAAVAGWGGVPTGWDIGMWSGCVLGRFLNYDMTDDAPSTAESRFRPWAVPSTYQQVGTVEGGRCSAINAYPLANGVRHCHGDNDWGHAGNGGGPSLEDLDVERDGAGRQSPSTPADSDARNAAYRHFVTAFVNGGGTLADARANARTPNFMCPAFPILPLTARLQDVRAALNAMRPEIAATGNGTNIAAGMQGAWYTLSPNWQGYWQDTNAGARTDGIAVPALPRPYNTRNNQKVVVILTDGDNNWPRPHGDNAACGDAASTRRGVCATPVAGRRELNYSGYGRISDWNQRVAAGGFTGTAIDASGPSNGEASFDDRFSRICTAMKARDILVYVVGFEVPGGAQRTLLQNCASPGYYVEARTAADLAGAFRQVADKLTSLRLVE
jgi:Flp pilus assembly protein TadG